MKGLRVTKYVKEIKFKGVLGDLKSKKGFQEQFAKFSFAFNVFLIAELVKNSHI